MTRSRSSLKPRHRTTGAEYALAFDYYGDGSDWSSSDHWKWYEHDDDMKELSMKFPDVLFTLHGEGEESTDMWTTYYRDGKMQTVQAEITYAPFDENLLK